MTHSCLGNTNFLHQNKSAAWNKPKTQSDWKLQVNAGSIFNMTAFHYIHICLSSTFQENFTGLFLIRPGLIIIKHREQDAQQWGINNLWRYHQLKTLEHLGPLHHLAPVDLWTQSAMGSRQKGYGDNAASLRESVTACLNALWHLYELYHLGY